jgi:hypothetical protein
MHSHFVGRRKLTHLEKPADREAQSQKSGIPLGKVFDCASNYTLRPASGGLSTWRLAPAWKMTPFVWARLVDTFARFTLPPLAHPAPLKSVQKTLLLPDAVITASVGEIDRRFLKFSTRGWMGEPRSRDPVIPQP